MARGENAAKRLVKTLEVGAGAAVAGALSVKRPKLGPVPVELAISAVALGAALFGVAGKYSDDLVNIGDGAFASWAANMGKRQVAGAAAGAMPQMLLPAGSSQEDYQELLDYVSGESVPVYSTWG